MIRSVISFRGHPPGPPQSPAPEPQRSPVARADAAIAKTLLETGVQPHTIDQYLLALQQLQDATERVTAELIAHARSRAQVEAPRKAPQSQTGRTTPSVTPPPPPPTADLSPPSA